MIYILLTVCVLSIAGGAVFAYLAMPLWSCVSLGAALAALMVIINTLRLYVRTTRTGDELLRSCDFASRLRPVGNPAIDNTIQLYNNLLDALKSERLKAREQNEFLSRLVAASPMGIAVCSFEGVIETSNSAFQHLASLEVVSTLESLPEGGESTLRLSDGQILRCSRAYFMDRGFRRPFFMVERLTDEIVQAETRVFHKIVRTIGHEVNNTLGAVISVLETLGDIHADEAPVKEAVDGSVDACRALGAFVKAYAEVVKLPEPVPEAVDLGRYLASLRPFLSKITPPDIELELRLGTPATISIDPMLMERVMVNIVKNAVESLSSSQVPQNGKIIIAQDSRQLEVIDNGPGISPEAAKKLFTPFYSTKRQDRGLGLMLVSDILRKHHAAYSLATTLTDTGRLTRFTITFTA